MTDPYSDLMGSLLLTSLAVTFSVGAIIAVVMGFCFLREYIHEANERWKRLKGDDAE